MKVLNSSSWDSTSSMSHFVWVIKSSRWIRHLSIVRQIKPVVTGSLPFMNQIIMIIYFCYFDKKRNYKNSKLYKPKIKFQISKILINAKLELLIIRNWYFYKTVIPKLCVMENMWYEIMLTSLWRHWTLIYKNAICLGSISLGCELLLIVRHWLIIKWPVLPQPTPTYPIYRNSKQLKW